MASVLDMRAPAAERYSRWLTEGYPELGWSGDPGLRLVFNSLEHRWEVWSWEPQRNDPERHVLICRGPIGKEMNDEAVHLLIRRLVEIDTRRPGNSTEDIVERVIKQNAKVEDAKTEQAVQATADALGKFYFEASKALGEPIKFHW